MLADSGRRRRNRSGDWMHGKACLHFGKAKPDPALPDRGPGQISSARNRGMA